MAQSSKARRKAYRAPRKKGSGNALWFSIVAVIVVLGVVGIVISRQSEADSVAPFVKNPATGTGDHWHAAFGVNVCGTWSSNISEFEQRAGSNVQAGIHSHGDGLIHIHPFQPSEAGNNATVGTYLRFAGYVANDQELELWDGTTRKVGDDCNGQPGVIRWAVNGEEQQGDPSDYKPNNGDKIGIYFTTPDQDLSTFGEVPGSENLAAPADMQPPADPSISIPVDPGVPTDPSVPTDSSLPADPSATTTPAETSATSTPESSAPGGG
jgi:hypothetical protein